MSRFYDKNKEIIFTFNDKQYKAKSGDSISTALFSNDLLVNRKTLNNTERGSFCYMGVCFECLVNVNGKRGVQSCKTRVAHGMEIKNDG